MEVAILEPITQAFFARLQEALCNILEVTVQPERHECSPEYVQAAPPDAPVVILTFDAKVGLANGIINICYPLPMVQSLIREIQGRSGQIANYYGRAEVGDARQRMLDSIMEVPLLTHVDLGQAVISAEDWLALDSGDVLLLDRAAGDLLTLHVGRSPAFTAMPGRSKQNLAVKMLERLIVKETQ